MLNRIKNYSLFTFLTFAILVFSFSATNAQKYSSNKTERTVEQKIFKKLLSLPYYGVFDHIAYQVNGNTVTLFGNVNNGINKSGAENAVKRIEGVERVVNNINILPPSSFDNTIRFQLVRSLANSGGLYRYLQEPNPSVRLIVKNGRVALEGYVANRSDANLMNILANGIPGVFNVQNNLIVERDLAR